VDELSLDTLADYGVAAHKNHRELKGQLRTAKKSEKPAIQKKIDK
jgi:hypothetical protein